MLYIVSAEGAIETSLVMQVNMTNKGVFLSMVQILYRRHHLYIRSTDKRSLFSLVDRSHFEYFDITGFQSVVQIGIHHR